MKLARVILGLAIASLGTAAFAAESDRHLVMLKGKGASASFQKEVDKLGGEITYSHDIGIAVVTGLSDDAAAALGGHKNVQEMVLDASFELDPIVDSSSVTSADAAPASPDNPADAFFYEFYQWNMRAIQADMAWDAGRLGSKDITVAILDSGIDYTHPDLAGLVDFSRSVSFVAPDPDNDLFGYSDELINQALYSDYFPFADFNFHGTHVAATVASNGFLAAGVTSQTTLMAVKVCTWYGSCPFSSVISGVLHAVDNGADVANMSLGGSFTKAGNGFFVGFINKVFNYANSKGTLIVVSAGNDAIDLDHDGNSYKAYCSAPNTICVSATGPTGYDFLTNTWSDVDALASYSNYGRSAINVAAPGGNSGDSVWAACSRTSFYLTFFGLDCSAGYSIVGVSGTSMASPHAAGVAALIADDVGRNPGRIKTKLQQTADDLGQRGTDPAYGKGRVNAYNAVSQ